MRIFVLRAVLMKDDRIGDLAVLDSRDEDFENKTLQWTEFFPTSDEDIEGYVEGRLSPVVFLFIGDDPQKIHDWAVMADYALEMMKNNHHRDYSFLPLDMGIMRDDIPGEAYTALGCFHRDLVAWNEKHPDEEMEPAFIEQHLKDGSVLVCMLIVPRSVGDYPGESLIRGNEADEAKQIAMAICKHWLALQDRDLYTV